MGNFNYNLEDIGKCLNDAEVQLRSLITNLMIESLGSDWEEKVWNEQKLKDLRYRQEEEKKSLHNQQSLNSLIDYCYLIDLEAIILNHWQIFKPIFNDKDKIKFYFNTLNNIRNIKMHSREVTKSDSHLCLGMCGDLMNLMDNWESGYIYTIAQWSFTTKFIEYIDNDDDDAAILRATKQSEEYLNDLNNKLGGNLEKNLQYDKNETWLLRIGGSHVKITSSHNSKGFDGKNFIASNVTLEFNDLELLERVIDLTRRPYWIFNYKVAGSFDVSTIVRKIENDAGKKSSSSAGQMINGNVFVASADYVIGTINNLQIRATLTNAGISLIYDGRGNSGALLAHKIFSIESILKILYGITPPVKVKELLIDSL